MSSLEISKISVQIDEKLLFKDFSLVLHSGQIAALYAPTGTGKTTLLNIIANINLGENVLCQGHINRDYSKVSYVFQEHRLIPALSVLKNVMLPIEKIFGSEKAEDKALEMLRLVELDHKCNEKAEKLSGGEKQRAAIARAFVYPADLFLLDEPFSSQDENKKQKLIELTKELVQKEGRMALVVSHNKEDFAKLGADIFTLSPE